MAHSGGNSGNSLLKQISFELETLFDAHEAVGLKGKMCVYTHPDQRLWRSKNGGEVVWFDRKEIPTVLNKIAEMYNDGTLPNSPMLLNPIIHTELPDGSMKAEGSGIMWATAFCLGVAKLSEDAIERLHDLGVMASPVKRGENDRAGLKIVAFSDKLLPPDENAWSVKGCAELYNLTDIQSVEYMPYYVLSGMNYLCMHGLFQHPEFADLKPKKSKSMDVQTILDASIAWDAYDRHHSLYKKFGTNVENIENNLKFYRLCARDIQLFDATGVRHLDADTQVGFDFMVEGWIPKGAVTVIGASGGTGKSSLAHNLAIKAAMDYRPGEASPTWLGSKINLNNCKGLVVYLSGEDGPAIVHSRAKVYDPEGRSHRLMVMRTDFGEGVTLGGFLKRLHKLPDVSMIVIDPARKYLTGDEDDAGVVSEFFEAIEEFAINKHAAMVVVHHLAKGAKPKHVSEIYDLLRGSQVFIDRPRVVIGMYRDGDYTVAGLAKNNIPPQLGMVQGERLYLRDSEKLELVRASPEQEAARKGGKARDEVDE